MVGSNNSVLTRVREKVPGVMDVGCICHLANIVASKAVKSLPLQVDDLLCDVFFHFQRSTKRKEVLKEFQIFTDTEPAKILKHCATRWLSLERCVVRLLEQWPAMRNYFESNGDAESPGRVKRCRDGLMSLEMWLYFAFLEKTLASLNDFNKMFQSGASQIGVMDAEIRRLLRSLLGRFVKTRVINAAGAVTDVDYNDRLHQHDDDVICVGWRAREFLDENDVNPETRKKFFSVIRRFYCIMVKVVVGKFPFGDRRLKAMGYLNPRTKDLVSTTEVEFLGRSFLTKDRPTLEQLGDETTDYLTAPAVELPRSDVMDDFWAAMENVKTPTGAQRFGTLCKLSRVVLTVPHSNAETERAFSMVRKIQDDSRGNLSHETLVSLMTVKLNNDAMCNTFKPSNDLVRKAKQACVTYRDGHSEKMK